MFNPTHKFIYVQKTTFNPMLIYFIQSNPKFIQSSWGERGQSLAFSETHERASGARAGERAKWREIEIEWKKLQEC